MNVAYHWGHLGDIAYSLPAWRALGGGEYVTALRKERHDWLAPLLEAQPYISAVRHDPRGRLGDWTRRPPEITHDFNRMRMGGALHIETLVALHAKAVDVVLEKPWAPWLTVPGAEPGKYDRAIVARSFRYRDPDADWDAEIVRLREQHEDVVFVGLESEWSDFGRGVQRVECATALDLARLIVESRYFAGNQSLPLSIAIGLGVEHTIEVAPGHSNCSFPTCPYQHALAVSTLATRPVA